VLRTQPGNRFGFDVDRLDVASHGGGDAWTGFDEAAGLTDVPSPPSGEPTVKTLESGRSKVSVRVSGADEPFWLVLGQSANPGWRATADGKALGESTLADGYGNGWLVHPRADGKPFEVDLEWVPQRTVNRAIAASIVFVVVCLAIVLVSLLRRRRRRREGLLPAAVEPRVDALLESPWVAPGRRPGVVGTVLTTLIALGVGAVVVTPWVGLLVGAAVLVVLLFPRWRGLLSLVPALALGGCALYIAAKQFHTHLPATFEWPTFFWQVRTLGWIAIVFLAADALVEIVRTRSHRSDPEPATEARPETA
jgi:arabinofuranan 3-O-arabinosyltransferase